MVRIKLEFVKLIIGPNATPRLNTDATLIVELRDGVEFGVGGVNFILYRNLSDVIL